MSLATDSAAGDRADLLSQIHCAQSDLDQLIAQLGNDAGSILVDGKAQRELLAQMERTLASGAAAPSPSLRSEVAGILAGTTSLAQQARAAIDQSGGSSLSAAQARTRASVAQMSRDIYERRIFDPYLQFDSAADEAAYHRREEQNRGAIDDALAEHSPEGDLRAARIMGRQLRDAKDHGADASPQFRAMAERNAHDIERLERATGRQPASEGVQTPGAEPGERPAPATQEQLASVLATFRAAGVAGGTPAQESGHGVNVAVSPSDQGRTI